MVGDVMLDRFVQGEISRISPEAPVPVLRTREAKSALGGAGNVVRNLAALGCAVHFVSVVGDDPDAGEIRQMLSLLEGIEANLVVESQRKTIVKTRFMAGRQQVLRVDTESTHPVEPETVERLKRAIASALDLCHIVVVSDYAKGLLVNELLAWVIREAKARNKAVIVDPKGKDYLKYTGATLLTPNLGELSEASGLPVNGDEAVVEASRKLIELCEVEAVLATRSQDGMTLVQASGEVFHLRAEAREVFDVSGAGDTAIAVLAAAYGAGASLVEAAALANVAAGIVVGKVGTAVAFPKEIIRAIRHQELSSAESKVMDLASAVDLVGVWRRKGYKVGFTNGVFDLVHPGHIDLLSKAAKVCDRLIVGLNGDTSVWNIRGEAPLQNETARSAVLASLEQVDMVVIFQDETPVNLLEALRPDVLIKGANYSIDQVVGADLVRSYGGEVVLVQVTDIYRTNSRIAKLTNGTF